MERKAPLPLWKKKSVLEKRARGLFPIAGIFENIFSGGKEVDQIGKKYAHKGQYKKEDNQLHERAGNL